MRTGQLWLVVPPQLEARGLPLDRQPAGYRTPLTVGLRPDLAASRWFIRRLQGGFSVAPPGRLPPSRLAGRPARTPTLPLPRHLFLPQYTIVPRSDAVPSLTILDKSLPSAYYDKRSFPIVASYCHHLRFRKQISDIAMAYFGLGMIGIAYLQNLLPCTERNAT